MGYPVRYRSAARKYQGGGFQEPVKVPGRGGSGQTRYSKPPKPDNDNWPLPYNDNIPGGGRPKPPKLPELPPIDIPGVAEQFGTIFLPPQVRQAINIANDAAQFYEWFLPVRQVRTNYSLMDTSDTDRYCLKKPVRICAPTILQYPLPDRLADCETTRRTARHRSQY